MPLQTITIIRLFSLSLYYPWRDPRFVGAKTRTHTTHGNSPLSWLGQEIRHDKAKPHGRAFFHMHMSSPHNTGSIRIGRPDIFRHSQFCVAMMYPLIGWAGLLVGEVQPVQRKKGVKRFGLAQRHQPLAFSSTLPCSPSKPPVAVGLREVLGLGPKGSSPVSLVAIH